MAARCLPARKPGRCHQAPRRPRCPARPASAFRARRSPTPAHLARTATCTDARWRSGSGCIRVQQDRADAAGLDVAAAFGNDIDQAIVLGQLHPHVRMRVQEARKPRPQLGRHRRAGGVDAQQAGRGGAELVQLFQRVMHLAQGRL
ncbi:hypothetical protein G6F23_013693 [Rhizopus arrhizus]|nr:hypothetical protein G6F23_013693 [Rhizopus arrhizus]